MGALTLDQLRFLRDQRIPMGSVFDASGMRKMEYERTMAVQGLNFAFGVSPCRAAGHTLRTRAGHCIQCDHSKIAYMTRYEAPGFVYIAGSSTGRLLKVGTSINIADRNVKLNDYVYGGQRDWQIVATAFCAAAGKVEGAAQSKLARFAAEGSYTRAGRSQQCYELFRCPFHVAIDAVRSSLPKGETLNVPDQSHSSVSYGFAP